jgi:hypothetical protein
LNRPKWNWAGAPGARARAGAHGVTTWGPRRPHVRRRTARRGRLRSAGSRVPWTPSPLAPHRLPPPLPGRHAPSAHETCRADRAAWPMPLPPYRDHGTAHIAASCLGAQGNTLTTALLTFKCRPVHARAHCAMARPLPPCHG